MNDSLSYWMKKKSQVNVNLVLPKQSYKLLGSEIIVCASCKGSINLDKLIFNF